PCGFRRAPGSRGCRSPWRSRRRSAPAPARRRASGRVPRSPHQYATCGPYHGPMIDAAGLRVMRAIAEEGSFTAAALSLGYSQPPVSQMVKRLEQRTGTVLVEKVGRSVRLTEAGAVLARHASPVLAALDAAEEEVAAIAGLRSGRVRLMAFPSSSVTLVPRALAAVRAEYPDLSVHFTEAEPPESIAALRAGEVDLAVAFSYAGSEIARGEDLDGFAVHPLLEEEV